MNEKQRQHTPPQQPADSADAPSTDAIAASRREADDLYAAADQAIGNALSGDSQAFLQANHQFGGQ